MLKTAIEAAEAAGKIIMAGYGKLTSDQIAKKGKGDYVTVIDKKAEETIINIIRKKYADHLIIAEESGISSSQSNIAWIIDPLDGTANFMRNIPIFAVSIGIRCNNILQAGVVYVPALDQLFQAEKGKGCYLNGKRIMVSETSEISEAMLATGFPWRFPKLIDGYASVFAGLMKKSGGMRRLGAAAVDLAYTACGIFDCFYEMRLKPWDIAAGALLVQEAGGLVTDLQGEENFMQTGDIIAGNKFIHNEIIEQFKSFPDHRLI